MPGVAVPAIAGLAGCVVAQVANVYVETPLFTEGTGWQGDPVDVAFGFSGAIIGTLAISTDAVKGEFAPRPDDTQYFLPGYQPANRM